MFSITFDASYFDHYNYYEYGDTHKECYAFVNYFETLEQATKRLEILAADPNVSNISLQMLDEHGEPLYTGTIDEKEDAEFHSFQEMLDEERLNDIAWSYDILTDTICKRRCRYNPAGGAQEFMRKW